jgi:hypothetical protein
MPKQEEHKLNLCLKGFEAKEGKIEKELVQRLNTELSQGQMKLHAKVIAATQQQPTTMQASAAHDKCTPQCGVTQVCNERRPPCHITRAQGLNRDQVGPGQKPHAHTTSTQVKAMVVIQRSQGDKQVRLLTRSRTFHRWYSNLPALLYLGARGPKRLMHGIMEHARGWCK